MRKQLNELKAGEIYIFTNECTAIGRENYAKMDGSIYMRKAGTKIFKCLLNEGGQNIEISISNSNEHIEIDNSIFDCFIHGRGFNKKLFYTEVITGKIENGKFVANFKD